MWFGLSHNHLSGCAVGANHVEAWSNVYECAALCHACLANQLTGCSVDCHLGCLFCHNLYAAFSCKYLYALSRHRRYGRGLAEKIDINFPFIFIIVCCKPIRRGIIFYILYFYNPYYLLTKRKRQTPHYLFLWTLSNNNHLQLFSLF